MHMSLHAYLLELRFFHHSKIMTTFSSASAVSVNHKAIIKKVTPIVIVYLLFVFLSFVTIAEKAIVYKFTVEGLMVG